ncbi:DUF4857 domain-containing protein [Dysgonomonas sp. 25]|uniref:DUF4857 domain-containing protein n=1 Tax=Dysgonomonas sp. 25 TaxID=2302933 RepID=UPI0013D02AE3|nr:DUF4857 domain-containing protein [Dysgonomonas sp. 25]NDV68500.1 DUF4857 domain-containing protein [Dysgonomonas sp. 25]
MKQKSKIYYLILLFVTFVGLWIIPSLVRKATYSPDVYPFVYQSSILKELVFIDYKDKQTPLTDRQGNKYTTAQFDSLMPLLNYRQLMSDGRLPDSLGGYELTPPLLRSKSVMFSYRPNHVQTPNVGLYILFESMPKRVGLEMPEDVFRLQDKIEFIHTETNTVDTKKSETFQRALEKEGFAFPAQWAIGNPTTMKPYDEGYFILDANGQLYHLKMVNGRPYVRNTHASDGIDIAHFSILEVSDKRFYGFLFSRSGELYILEANEGKYIPVKLDVPAIDIKQDQLNIRGNLLYWTVTVTTPQGRNFYALETETLKQVDAYTMERTENNWDKISGWLFPYYLTFEDAHTDYIRPYFHFTGIWGFGIYLFLAVIGYFLVPSTKNKRFFNALYILLTGFAGFVALLVLPKYRK